MNQAQSLQQAGQDAYRKKDYPLALSLFTRALEHASIPEVQVAVLDNRAATLEKLGTDNLMPALRDAKRMIKLQKTSVKGYLRTGKILQLRGEDEAALSTYRYGLQKIPVQDEGSPRHLVEGMYNKLRDRLVASNRARCRDPFQALPAELVDMILDHLPFTRLMVSTRVSKGWRIFITSRYKSYSTLDFSAAINPVCKLTIKAYLEYAKGNVTKAILGKKVPTDTRTLNDITRICKRLSELHILRENFLGNSLVDAAARAQNLTTLVIECSTSISTVMGIIERGSNLETLVCTNLLRSPPQMWAGPVWDIHGPGKLKELTMGWDGTISTSHSHRLQRGFKSFTENLPELRQLELVNTPFFVSLDELRGLKSIEVLVLRNCRKWPYPTLPAPSVLRHLRLVGMPELLFTEDLIRANPFPYLEVLEVSHNSNIQNSSVLLLLEESHSVRVLILDMCPRIDADSLDWLLDAGHGDTLEELSLAGNPTFGDQVTNELGRLCNLRRLSVAHTLITGVGVVNLVNGSKLESLGLDFCHNVGKDAVQLVRNKGIQVSHRLSEPKGGKKVRY